MKQWAILIGLDKYQSFQPLNCAQQDVQALHRFLVSEAGFPLTQCLLFTELSPFLAGRSTYPSRENLCNWIEFLAQRYFQPDDQVWIFLNGYGVCHGGQDYFVPIDGNPAAIESTCIEIAPLLNRLKSALPNGQPLLLLDISRSQGTISNETVGIQTAQVAHQLGIPTILSCQPGQFSREISSLGHGLFTASLLEGLRYQQGANLATLSHYLSDRLPELSEHYWQPIQHPVTICPPHLVHQPLLVTAPSWNGSTSNGHSPQNATEIQSTEVYSVVKTPNSAAFTLPTANVAPQSYSTGQSQLASDPSRSADQITSLSNGQSHSGYNAGITPVSHHSAQVESLENSYRGDTPATVSVPTPVVGAVEPEPHEEGSLWRPFLLWGGLISLGLLSAVLWRNWSVVLAAPASQQSPSALNAAPVASSLQQRASLGQDILRSARMTVRSDQATPYQDAIQQARRIQADDGVYQEAQQDIANWSQTIYDIAQDRASRKQFDTAVMAADLVPLENQNLRPQANAAIADWCQLMFQQNGKVASQQPAISICERGKV
ncbi:caspase family protein [Phormidium sp. CLA17]|uniref:caspase family protein n=1 Tax=Leptolyngbya sp. Cla-17 TaxID=2803751 RepID=UPI001490BBB2|nr:caspase family protein [Leptolyngbya sp. Cla-17]MBM0741473.1 caspase family protein [Leptolyngbya sp. Cla-17]